MSKQSDESGREHELLSALMDGEAGEHELRQVLRALASPSDDTALTDTWTRYHLAQSALHRDASAFAGVDLRAGIAARLADEPALTTRTRAWAWSKPLFSMAVAASVAMATVLGWQLYTPVSVPGVYEGGGSALAGMSSAGSQKVALGPMVVVSVDTEELVMPVTDEAVPTSGQDRLNAYFVRHAQATTASSSRGLTPYARVVSVEGGQGRTP